MQLGQRDDPKKNIEEDGGVGGEAAQRLVSEVAPTAIRENPTVRLQKASKIPIREAKSTGMNARCRVGQRAARTTRRVATPTAVLTFGRRVGRDMWTRERGTRGRGHFYRRPPDFD